MLVGVVFNAFHSLQAGPAIMWMNTDEGFTDELSNADREYPNARARIAIPLTLSYTFNTLNYQTLPTSGIFMQITDTAVFPLSTEELPFVYNMSKVDFSVVFPAGKRFSIATNLFVGTDTTQNLQKIPYQMPVFGYNSFDRMYFPHVSGKTMYGAHKGAMQLALLFQPWDNVTILGGQLVFSVSAAVGEVIMGYDDFDKDDLLWNTSFNVGVRINKTFGVQIRIGAGAFDETIMPFLSLDVGTIRF
jgi:NTE family protein